jgi:hypothetical protein
MTSLADSFNVAEEEAMGTVFGLREVLATFSDCEEIDDEEIDDDVKNDTAVNKHYSLANDSCPEACDFKAEIKKYADDVASFVVYLARAQTARLSYIALANGANQSRLLLEEARLRVDEAQIDLICARSVKMTREVRLLQYITTTLDK